MSSRTLILSDGSLASLIACAHAREAADAAAPGLMFFGEDDARGARSRAAAMQAEIFALELLQPPAPLSGVSAGETQSLRLVAAAYAAARAGCAVVVWPVQCPGPEMHLGVDIDAVARASDRAVLAGRLAAIGSDEHNTPAIRIETPFIDMTDRQLADLAAEMELPLKACWWFGERSSAEFKRWAAALESVGYSPRTIAAT